MGVKPDFVDEQGSRWFAHDNLTKYAKDVGLEGVGCWRVESPGDPWPESFVIMRNKKFTFSSTNLEDVASHLDVMALRQRTSES